MAGDAREGRDYKQFVVNDRLRYFKPSGSRAARTFAEEVSVGLQGDRKSIPSRFFYDARGSELFEQICNLPEYYLTRTEAAILEAIQDDLSRHVGKDCRLVELGSGSSAKTRLILDALSRPGRAMEYFPIDISDILTESSEILLAEYENLRITGIIDTYEGGLEFLGRLGHGQSLVVFLGSSYGNFAPSDGRGFMERISSSMRPGDLLLIGLDLVKDAAILEPAYNDSSGITARFNLNMLSRINDELDADFDLDCFEHVAIYNESEQRIEMYLRSLADQSAILSKPGQVVRLRKGQLIHTEYSYKFRPGQIRDLLHDAGLETVQTWHDDRAYFSLTLASKT